MTERIIDERRFKREDSFNIVDYVVLGDDGEPEDSSMGRTLNVGEAGILLETHVPLKQEQLLLVSVGFEDDMVELKGKVTYTATFEEYKHHAGIEFMEIDYRDRLVLREYLKALVYKSHYPKEEKDNSQSNDEIPQKKEEKEKEKEKDKKKKHKDKKKKHKDKKKKHKDKKKKHKDKKK